MDQPAILLSPAFRVTLGLADPDMQWLYQGFLSRISYQGV